jgi:Xaa-Pro aminopeptidase
MQTAYQRPPLPLNGRLAAIANADYPRFSEAEMKCRRDAMLREMAELGVEHLIVCGSGFRGGPVHWLSDWLTTHEALLVFSADKTDTIFIHFYNHLPQARRLMPEVDIQWAGPSIVDSALGELKRRGAKRGTIGFLGAAPFGYGKRVSEAYGEVRDLSSVYNRLRLIKSAAEIERARIGAAMTDASIAALMREIRPALTQRDLGAIVEGAYLPWAGVNVIHFFGLTSMASPDIGVPCQHPSTRRIESGDVVTCELTANFWEYGGQVLRTFVVGSDLNPLYRDLHAAADAAFASIVSILRPGCRAADIVRAASPIEDAGFTTCDDLVHGFGGGYLAPVLGSPSRQIEEIPDLNLEVGMMLVVQPNVMTKDGSAGVQTGECFFITENGAESLHTAPRGVLRVPVAAN